MGIGVQTVRRLYQEAFARHGDTPSAVLLPKGRQAERWAAMTGDFEEGPVLDFGCGLAHLKTWIDENRRDLEYFGADMVPEFVAAARVKFPDTVFFEVSDPGDLRQSFRYTLASGTFNLLYVDDDRQHWRIVQEILYQLWQVTTDVMAVDFMHTMVDYRQQGAYHQKVEELIGFVRTTLSRRLKLDFTYLPYEFTAIIRR
jgi:hypothetical protein